VENLAQVTTSSPGDDPGNNSDTARLTVIVPDPLPPLSQRLPRTGEVALGQALPWWLPWLVTALGLMVIGALLTFRVEPALRRAVAAQAQHPGSSVSRRPLAPPRPRQPIGRPARRSGYVRQAPGRRAQPEPVAVTSPLSALDSEHVGASAYAAWSAGASLREVVKQARRETPGPSSPTVREEVLRALDAELTRAHALLVEQRLRLLRESAAPPCSRQGRHRRR
jgi:hypothetical protein